MKFIAPWSVIDNGGTFTRSTTAQYKNSSGRLSTAAINAVRYEYDNWPLSSIPTTILEPPVTNLLKWSAYIGYAGTIITTGTPWTINTANTTMQTDVTVFSPWDQGASTWNSDKLCSNTGALSVAKAASQIVTVSAVQTLTFSTFLKAAEVGFARLVIASGANGANYVRVDVDLTSGACTATNFGDGSGATAYAEQYWNGWWRVVLTGKPTLTTSASTTVRIVQIPSIGVSEGFVSSSINDGFFVDLSQLETGAVATTYIDSPAVVPATQGTRAGDVNTATLISNLPETDYAQWSSATNYAIGDKVIRTTLTTHKIYQCLIAGVNATAPELSLTGTSPRWQQISSTNRWLMFDDYWSTQSSLSSVSNTMIDVNISHSINSIAILDMAYISYIRIVVTGTTYDTTFSVSGKTDFVATDLTVNISGHILITLVRSSTSAAIGKISLGQFHEIGDIQYGSSVNITDYSTKTTDTWGNTTIVKKKYTKNLSAKVAIKNTLLDSIYNYLATYRSTPMTWIGNDNQYTALIVYGYYRDFDINIEQPETSICTLNIEGLT